MNVDKLEGAELDAAVARAAGLFIYGMERMPASEGGATFVTLIGDGRSPNLLGQPEIWTPSRSWAHGGPILERERIVVIPCEMDGTVVWVAIVQDNGLAAVGDWFDNKLEDPATTPLIAAMRAFVRSKQNP